MSIKNQFDKYVKECSEKTTSKGEMFRCLEEVCRTDPNSKDCLELFSDFKSKEIKFAKGTLTEKKIFEDNRVIEEHLNNLAIILVPETGHDIKEWLKILYTNDKNRIDLTGINQKSIAGAIIQIYGFATGQKRHLNQIAVELGIAKDTISKTTKKILPMIVEEIQNQNE